MHRRFLAALTLGLAPVAAAADAPPEVELERFPRYARLVARAGCSPIPAAATQAQAPAPPTALTPDADNPPPVIAWDEAVQHLDGPPVTVVGRVVETYMATDYLCLLRFDLNRERFYIALFDRAYTRMNLPEPPAAFFEGKTIRVTGRVTRYRDRPNMTVRDPAALELVE